MLEQPHITRMIARNHPELERIFVQIQLDITTTDNRDAVGPTILALKHIQDIFSLFKAKGDVLIAQEAREDAKAKLNQTR